MRRRNFIAGVLAVAASKRAGAQTGKGRRLAIFSPSEPEALMNENSENRYYRALFAELKQLGYAERENLNVDRWGREKSGAGPATLAMEVVRSAPDAVYIIGPGALLFKQITTTLPIVALTGDPVAQGLAQSLGRPGGNITGVSVDTGPTIHGKRIGLLREVLPRLSRLAWLISKPQWEGQQGAATRTFCESEGISLIPLVAQAPGNEVIYREAIAQVASERANAIMVADNPDTMTNRALIVNLVRDANVPAIYALPEFVAAGGLMAYSFDLVELNKRAADNIAAILRGGNPAEIPFYQASKFELSINLRTAKAQKIEVPPTLLASADEVIE